MANERMDQFQAAEHFLGLMGSEDETELDEDVVEELDEGAPEETEEVSDDEESEEPVDEEEVQEGASVVEIDGREVPVDELVAAYRSNNSEAQAAFAQQMEQLQQERAIYAQMLPVLAQQIESLGGVDEPDWDALYNDNPAEYVRQKDLWREKQERLLAVQQEQVRIQQQQMFEQREQFQQTLAKEQAKLLQELPEWNDKQVAAAEQVRLREYGLKLGFSEDELANVFDHRAVLTLRKAMLYDDLQKSKVKVKPPSKSVRPGTTDRTPTAKKKMGEAMNRLARTGRKADAAKAFELLIGD